MFGDKALDLFMSSILHRFVWPILSDFSPQHGLCAGSQNSIYKRVKVFSTIACISSGNS